MMTKLTHKEHMARAMLMGRTYDWTDGTYCFTNERGVTPEGMICCDSLEYITETAAYARRERVGITGYDQEGYRWRDPPKHETPWARMDDD